MRHVLLPSLEARFPRASEHLVALARMLAEDEDVLGSLVAGVPRPALGRPVSLPPVAALPPALRHRWVLALAAELPLAEPPDQAQLRGCRRAAGERADRLPSTSAATGCCAAAGSTLVLCPPPVRPFEPSARGRAEPTVLPGGFRVSLGERRDAVGAGRPPGVADARPARGRPALAAAGGRGDRGLGDMSWEADALLARLGVPAEWRRAWPLLEAGGRMVWIPGVGAAPAWAGEVGHGVLATLEEPWKRHVR